MKTITKKYLISPLLFYCATLNLAGCSKIGNRMNMDLQGQNPRGNNQQVALPQQVNDSIVQNILSYIQIALNQLNNQQAAPTQDEEFNRIILQAVKDFELVLQNDDALNLFKESVLNITRYGQFVPRFYSLDNLYQFAKLIDNQSKRLAMERCSNSTDYSENHCVMVVMANKITYYVYALVQKCASSPNLANLQDNVGKYSRKMRNCKARIKWHMGKSEYKAWKNSIQINNILRLDDVAIGN